MTDPRLCGRQAGDEYDFTRAEYVRLEPLDTWILANPPPADATVLDPLGAWDRYWADLKAIEYALTYSPRDPGLEALCVIGRNMRAWDKFWAVRHPSPEWRRMHDRVWRRPEIVEAQAELRQSIERYCARRGIDPETLLMEAVQ